jgi:23S rRNA (cytidine2498-2'-O)-methyltransferase
MGALGFAPAMRVPFDRMCQILVSISPAYFGSAKTLLKRSIPDARMERFAPDTALLSLDDADADHVAGVIRADVPFVRHLGFTAQSIDASDGLTPESVAQRVAERVPPDESGISLQVWASGDAPLDPTMTRRAIQQAIRGLGIDVQYGGQQRIVGVYMCASRIVLMVTPLDKALCDWPGGRMRFRASPAQISRAEFKLEEVLALCPFDLPERGTALDLGSSPGGWTRILLEKGSSVWAVDPGLLDPRVGSDPRVTYRRMTANDFLDEARDLPRFQLVVNDMRMAPELSCQLTVQAAKVLEHRGYVILTLKITPRTALDTWERSRRILERDLELVFARQLFHNRNELTVVARKR